MTLSTYHPRASVSGISTARWKLDEDLTFYADSGIGHIGATPYKFAQDLEHGVTALQAANLRISSVLAATVGLAFIGPDAVDPLEALVPAIDVSLALGSPPCFFVVGPAPRRTSTDEALAALGPALTPVFEYARSNAVPLAIECSSTATRDKGFIHLLADAFEFAGAHDIGVCVELQNCWHERYLPRLFAKEVARIRVVQVSDFVFGEEARLNRRVPGDGDLPIEWLVGSLLEAGYTGPFELEVIGPAIEAEGYGSAIRRGLTWLSELLDRWGA